MIKLNFSQEFIPVQLVNSNENNKDYNWIIIIQTCGEEKEEEE